MDPTQSLKSLLEAQAKEQPRKWIPFDAIEEIFGSVNGQRSIHTLRADTKKLQAFSNNSKRLWALLVCVDRLEWLESFCASGFDDDMFPIYIQGNRNIQSCNKGHTVTMPVKTVEDKNSLDSIREQQWQFFVPIFKPERPIYTFESDRRMPFLREIGTERTNFSVVTEFVMHRKHLAFRSSHQIVRRNLPIIHAKIGSNEFLHHRGPRLMRPETLMWL